VETIRFEGSGDHLGDARAMVAERTGGVSEGPFASLNLGQSTPDEGERVAENHRRAIAALELRGDIARVRLEHGAKIVYAVRAGDLGVADALWTDRPELVLSLTVADCYPVALVHAERRALVHCGWRGVAAGILEASVAALRDAARMRAWIGPGICADCYPVGPEVAAVFPDSAHPIAGTDRSRLDLRSEIRARLRRLGLSDDAIAASASCTAEEPARFFSHRRDGFPAGRMAAYLFLAPRTSQPDSA
jgi:YfiH family protein